MIHYDSTGKVITVGDRVRFRSAEYTIKAFGPDTSRGAPSIEFEEPVPQETLDTWGPPDEWGVDLLKKES
jgi:hypothetical protein